ncbi:MAG: Asp-tRNA(Asn)/Glu-tRNA(Gln) amidotransferase subunit GatB [Coriobacteriales bacterium]|nr:Asp-tRNA(Asn)/Glu-tRNA(Gln) amidotransferase subunit GatB [Coriobacteriales bacterium]
MKQLNEVLRDWEAVIGLEVHTELTTLNTKMFCSCTFAFGEEANSEVCPICLGLPGSLPSPNRAAIESIVMAGLATGCEIMPDTMFYRKHYFYPDMTKNYQVTQGPIAFCMNGVIELEVTGKAAEEREYRQGTVAIGDEYSAVANDAAATSDSTVASDSATTNDSAAVKQVSAASAPGFSPASGTANTAALDAAAASTPGISLASFAGGYRTRIGITRIHMEEDAGKLVHIGGTDGRISGAAYSLVDYNRCGSPLIELVTEPDLRSPEEARLFLQKLRQIYLTLGISNVSMEEGSLRCDGNISLRRRGETAFGTKTELKNMNSFKNLHDGLSYEICRQAEVLENGGTVRQETRHWEPATKRTIAMRNKETADDYRYFPDPDLAPFHLTSEFIESVRGKLPELPDAKKARYVDKYALPASDAGNLAGDPQLAGFFDAAMAMAEDSTGLAKPIANLLLNDISAWVNQAAIALIEAPFTPTGIYELVQLNNEGTISSKQLKEVFAEMASSGKSPGVIVDERGLRQVSDSAAIEAAIEAVLAANPDKVSEYQSGKSGLLGFFVGQVMRQMQGQGNPQLINELLSARLAK